MAFLMDAPMLVASGMAISKVAPDEAVARKLERATVVAFIAGATAFYVNAPGFDTIAKKVFRSEDGREFMVNSMVLNLDHRKLTGKRHLVAVGLLASYPLWMKLGRRLGRRA